MKQITTLDITISQAAIPAVRKDAMRTTRASALTKMILSPFPTGVVYSERTEQETC